MRVAVAGDKNWHADDLAGSVVTRLLRRYGPGLVIVHGRNCGVDQSFSVAREGLGVKVDLYLVDYHHVGDYRYANHGLIRGGAGLCLIVHRSALDKASR
jgi:hypothetical protein